MEREPFLQLLEQLAPLQLAEAWDNVGVLVEPLVQRAIGRVLVTIDLTERVFEEAQAQGADAIVAYHPPIFAGLKRLTVRDPRERLVLRLVESAMLIYSPHTALDAITGGVNDWLAQCFEWTSCRAIRPAATAISNAAAMGQGRLLELQNPITLETAAERVKVHLGLKGVRVATGSGKIRTVALCAGAGGSILPGVTADLYLTGELRHHDVLLAQSSGTHVILTEHSNSERGYLPTFCQSLREAGEGALEVFQSQLDADPLRFI